MITRARTFFVYREWKTKTPRCEQTTSLCCKLHYAKSRIGLCLYVCVCCRSHRNTHARPLGEATQTRNFTIYRAHPRTPRTVGTVRNRQTDTHAGGSTVRDRGTGHRVTGWHNVHNRTDDPPPVRLLARLASAAAATLAEACRRCARTNTHTFALKARGHSYRARARAQLMLCCITKHAKSVYVARAAVAHCCDYDD